MSVLPPLRLTGAIILREGELRQRSVAIARGRITKGPLPAVDMAGYLILPGIIDLFHQPQPDCPLDEIGQRTAAAGITTAWLAPSWSWEGSRIAPQQARGVLQQLSQPRKGPGPDLRPALSVETFRTDTTSDLIDLMSELRPELVYLTSELDDLLELRRLRPLGFGQRATQIGLPAKALSLAVDLAEAQRGKLPRHLCRLAEALDDLGIPFGSIGDGGGDRREAYSMIGARLAACPRAYSAAAAAAAMGDPVLLSARHGAQSREFLTARLGNALVSEGVPEAMAPLALSLAGPDLAHLPRIWQLLAENPAEIMRQGDRGRLDLGRRADLVILCPQTGTVQATICAGELAFAQDHIREKFAQVAPAARTAGTAQPRSSTARSATLVPVGPIVTNPPPR